MYMNDRLWNVSYVTQTGWKALAEYVRNVTHKENLVHNMSFIVQEWYGLPQGWATFPDYQACTGFILWHCKILVSKTINCYLIIYIFFCIIKMIKQLLENWYVEEF